MKNKRLTRRQILNSAAIAGAALAIKPVSSLAQGNTESSNIADWINVKNAGLKGDGKTNDTEVLKVLLRENSSGATFYFPPGKYTITENVEVPESISFVMDNGAILQITKKSTFTMNGSLDSSLQQVFSGAGKVRGSLGNNVYYPQWWGAKADGETDCAFAIDAAIESASASGNGTVFLSNGIYLLQEVTQEKHDVFLTPRSNVALIGEGDSSILKVADGLNAKLHGWNVIYGMEASNVLFRDFKVDCNGENNLQTDIEAKAKFKNAVIGIRKGSRITVDNVSVKNNAGRQCFMFGNNTYPHSTADVTIRNCRVDTVGGSVKGNIHQNDHSVIYLQCNRGHVQNNTFFNPEPSENRRLIGTAFEIHSSNCIVSGNVLENFNTGINLVAGVVDQINSTYSDNVFHNVGKALRLWSNRDMKMDNIAIKGNTFVQNRDGSSPIIDLSSRSKTTVGKISISDNFLSCAGEGTEQRGSGIEIGDVRTIVITNNIFENLMGRAISLGHNTDKTSSIFIEGNLIHNCCLTTKKGYQTAITLHAAQTKAVKLLRIRGNNFVRDNENAMTGGITGVAPILQGWIEDNLMEGIEEEITWSDKSILGLFLVEHKGKRNPEGVVRASLGSTWLNIEDGTYWHKTEGENSAKGWTKQS